MQISTIVTLGDGDSLAYTADAAAAQVLAALGANPTKDYCVVTISQHAGGEAGTPPAPELPPPPA